MSGLALTLAFFVASIFGHGGGAVNGLAYYNEVDPYAAQYLRNLIGAGLIAPGDVDERSIVDVRPGDLRGYAQCHFFAGEGVWSGALRRAGWDDSRPVWTGSCPCQPFSDAGQGKGFEDERHLWPAFHALIAECRPLVCFGEQVASKDALAWLDAVQADLEAADYAVGTVDFCAASVGAPHIRQRLYWVADALFSGRPERRAESGDESIARSGSVIDLADPSGARLERVTSREMGEQCTAFKRGSGSSGLGHADRSGSQPRELASTSYGYGCPALADGGSRRLADSDQFHGDGSGFGSGADCGELGEPPDLRKGEGAILRPGPTNGFWGASDWLRCRDERWRPVEPGTFPLAHGATARVGRLRAHGNAICLEQAAEFISAYRFARGEV